VTTEQGFGEAHILALHALSINEDDLIALQNVHLLLATSGALLNNF